MKLKKLIIHNIASIADAEIDFSGEGLRDEAVFLICGETGSGKTTILDALCLALYNKTPRLSQATARESYTDVNGESITLSSPVQYLRKGAWEAAVKLTFESGGKDWEASWSTHRANRRTDGRFQGIIWEITDTASGVSSKGSEIEKIISLSFDEFKRTTMLAQGEFTAFLKSRDDEKSAILEKITGTGIYKEIGRKISERYRQSQQEYSAKQDIIKGITENMLDEEEEKKITDDLEQQKQKSCQLETERNTLEKISKAFTEKKRLETEIRRHTQTLEKAAEECSKLKGGILYAEEVLSKKEAELIETEAFINHESPYADMYGNHSLIISELNRITTEEGNIGTISEKITLHTEALKTISEEKKKDEERFRLRKAAYEEMAEKVRRITEAINEMPADSLRRTKEAIETVIRLTNEEAKISTSLKETESKLSVILKKEAEISACHTEAEKKLKDTTALYERMKESNEQWAKDARANLTVGGNCPVCGQIIASQEYLDSISDSHFESILTPVREKLETEKAQAASAAQEHMKCMAEVKHLQSLAETFKENMQETVSSLNKANEEYGNPDCSKEHYDLICLKLEKVEGMIREKDKMSTDLNKAYEGVMEAQKLISDISLKQEKCQGEIRAAEIAIKEAEGRIKASYEYAGTNIKWLEWEDAWNSDRSGFTSNLKDRSESYFIALRKQNELKGVNGKIKEGLDSIHLSYEDILSLMPSLADVQCGEKVKIDRLEGCLNALKADITTSIAESASAGRQLEAIQKDTVGYRKEDVYERMTQINQELLTTNQTIGSYVKTLETNKENRQKVGKILQELEACCKERDQWKALNDVFGKRDGEYFQKIAQGFIMNDILGRANHYLREITRRYILEAQHGSLNIVLRDMEQGGIPRSTSTISGGESFMVSLALALGLSSLGNGGISADILFIDEGFGSLSEDYLNTVIETLQKLHESSGKKVGIISHVEQLRERISTKITVSKVNQTTSNIAVTRG